MTLVSAARLLDTPPEEAFDRLTRLAARLLGAPVALVTLADDDRVFFKSAMGLPEPWASRRGHAARPTPSAVTWSRRERRWWSRMPRRHPVVRTNPAIRELGWIAYAGVPLTVSAAADGGRAVRDRRAPARSGRRGTWPCSRTWPRRS